MAGDAAPADLVERDPAGHRRRDVPGLQVHHLVGGVERDRPEHPGVAGRERLGEVGAVGVAVEVDRAGAQRGQHPGQVACGARGGVQVAAVDEAPARPAPGVVELLAAAGHQPLVELVRLAGAEPLQRLAVDDLGGAGAAVVDQQQVAPPEQRLEELEVGVARAGARVPGAALLGDDRAQHPARAAGRVPLQADPDGARRRVAVVEGHRQVPAPGAFDVLAGQERERAHLAGCPLRRRPGGRRRRPAATSAASRPPTTTSRRPRCGRMR